jgi:hypothetical protein
MNDILIVALENDINLIVTEKLHGKFTVNDDVYTEVFCDDFCGFYDWLRNDEKIIGIRFNGFDFAEEFIKRFPKYSYINLVSNNIIEFYFGQCRKYDLNKSGDQDFGCNKIYLSDNNVYAISFDFDLLNVIERDQILKLAMKMDL